MNLIEISEREVLVAAKAWARLRGKLWDAPTSSEAAELALMMPNVIDNLAAAVALLESREQSEANSPTPASYRIEKRRESGEIEYWRSGSGFGLNGGFWVSDMRNCTIYTEAERVEFLNRETRGEANDRFPAGGVWVRVW